MTVRKGRKKRKEGIQDGKEGCRNERSGVGLNRKRRRDGRKGINKQARKKGRKEGWKEERHPSGAIFQEAGGTRKNTYMLGTFRRQQEASKRTRKN